MALPTIPMDVHMQQNVLSQWADFKRRLAEEQDSHNETAGELTDALKNHQAEVDALQKELAQLKADRKEELGIIKDSLMGALNIMASGDEVQRLAKEKKRAAAKKAKEDAEAALKELE